MLFDINLQNGVSLSTIQLKDIFASDHALSWKLASHAQADFSLSINYS